jgi:hypothetical protein
MLKTTGKALLLIMTFLAIGCSGSTQSDPKAVADQFWSATKTGKIVTIKPYVSQASLSHEMMKEDAQATTGNYSLGEAKIENDMTTIPTSLKDNEVNIEFQTIVVKEGNAWKVDIEKTMMTMFNGAMGELMNTLKNVDQAQGNTDGMIEEVADETIAKPSDKPAEQAADTAETEVKK